MQLVGAFAFFFLFQFFILPSFIVLYALIYKGSFTNEWLQNLNTETLGWLSVIGMGSSFLAMTTYYKVQRKEDRLLIWQRGEEKNLRQEIESLFFGMATWLIAYPIVFFIGQGISMLLFFGFGIEESEQAAVRSLKMTMNYPFLNLFMILSIALFVPIMEELLFRGFLQTWLRGKVAASSAIVVTSLIFAIFHYSHSQGISNIEYIFALFFLSCFLGLIYERQRSLWAPIGLHVAFNTFSILFILLS